MGKKRARKVSMTRKLPVQARSSLRIAIATAPQVSREGVSLAEDIRLVKPALLYADTVTLYSPAAAMLLLVGGVAHLSAQKRMVLVRQLYPLFKPEQAPVLLAMLDDYQRLDARKRGRSRDELLAYLRLRPEMERLRNDIDRVWNDELIPTVETMLESAGATELAGAMSAGLLVVDPLVKGNEEFDNDRVIEAFVAKLAEVLSGRGIYPLFDDQTGTLVRHGLSDGLFKASPITRERGKQVAAASEFLTRLPAFPKANVSEILDIRAELEAPLVRFRAAMVDLGRLVESAAYEEEFPEQVDELYRAKVEPALLEIEEQVRSNSYLRVLIGEIVGDSKTLLAGILAVGIAHAADLPQLVAGGAAAGQVIAKAAWEKHIRGQQISEHELYFLYRTEHLLADKA